MTTAAPTLRLGACPRCTGPLALHRDQYGNYWSCLPCGFHSDDDVPPEVRIRRPEAMRAFQSVFDYAGSQKVFQGYRIRGRLLPAKPNETYMRFDLACPYANCSCRQLATLGRYKILELYECKNKHRIHLNVEELTWC